MKNIAPNTLNQVIGGVTFFFQPDKTGGYIDCGHLEANSIKFTSARGEFYSERTGVRKLINSWAKDYNIEFKIAGPEAQKFAWQLATLSSAPAAQTQAAGDVTDEDVTAKLDRYVALANQIVSSVVVKDAATGLTTYTNGTDYEIDAQMGMIRCLSTGTITADLALHVSYTKAAMTSLQQMYILQSSRFTGDAYFLIRSNNGHVSRFYFPSVEIQPDGDIAISSEKPASICSFTGKVLWDSTQTSGQEYGKFQELVAASTSS